MFLYCLNDWRCTFTSARFNNIIVAVVHVIFYLNFFYYTTSNLMLPFVDFATKSVNWIFQYNKIEDKILRTLFVDKQIKRSMATRPASTAVDRKLWIQSQEAKIFVLFLLFCVQTLLSVDVNNAGMHTRHHFARFGLFTFWLARCSLGCTLFSQFSHGYPTI